LGLLDFPLWKTWITVKEEEEEEEEEAGYVSLVTTDVTAEDLVSMATRRKKTETMTSS